MKIDQLTLFWLLFIKFLNFICLKQKYRFVGGEIARIKIQVFLLAVDEGSTVVEYLSEKLDLKCEISFDSIYKLIAQHERDIDPLLESDL